MTDDKNRQRRSRITGNELKPADIIGQPGPGGPTEIRYRAHGVYHGRGHAQEPRGGHNRRKALVYVSDGYDFVPELASGLVDPSSPFEQNEFARQQRCCGPAE
jgi:hypothetical protein